MIELQLMVNTPGGVVKIATRFLTLLFGNEISPKHAIQRSMTTWGQVAVSTFNKLTIPHSTIKFCLLMSQTTRGQAMSTFHL